MKLIISKRAGWFAGVVAGICLLAVFLLNVIGYCFNWRYVSIFAAASETNKYEVRSYLLTEAMDQVGVCCPEDAADVWSNGLVTRSAALQYSVMNKELKEEYANQLEKSAPNWVTGMSSPWVDSYKIVKTQTPSENSRIIELTYSTATSTGPAGDYKAVLTIAKEGDFWRITEISADPGLYPYMGFTPEG